LIAQDAEHDSLGLIVVGQSATAIARKRDNVRTSFLVENTSACHADIVVLSRSFTHASCRYATQKQSNSVRDTRGLDISGQIIASFGYL